MDQTKQTLKSIPLLKTKAGPRDVDLWPQRLKEEYQSLIQYVQNNKAADNDWFRLESNKEGTKWFGKCWVFHDQLKYEFDIEFDIPVTFPTTAPEIALPELDGKTAKMYRGGKICLSDHFKPLWARNVPKFGISHALALGLGPWLAVEIPELIQRGVVQYKEKDETK
ncbi:ubiquitin-fold modifier-conjugating enzyme 1 [Daktulosphaira vitifoliae]|uniref:Ubiquitin-fold modifier-conjugating enzyme 1 n=1 Tax=Daktulosphaira vitifoliae TaxID=58002 RepID=A0A481SW17_DAKVI|nr:ubiquitin-fold modifier-conjugating enzyme 1 [Daktulosphaira vitifoliae]QBH72956.1 ubiquitin-fold modifier-conjugating enzyme 1 [Daktulosphaira vitifoliae]